VGGAGGADPAGWSFGFSIVAPSRRANLPVRQAWNCGVSGTSCIVARRAVVV